METSRDQTAALRTYFARMLLFLGLPIIWLMFTTSHDSVQAAPYLVDVLVLEGDDAGLRAAEILQAEIESNSDYLVNIHAVQGSTLNETDQMRAIGEKFQVDAVIWQSGANLQVELITSAFQRALAQVQ